MPFVRTPCTCSICGVMGHNKRTCRIVRLRREGEQMGEPLTQQEEQRVKADLQREFNESPIGIHWNTYQRELTERNQRARQERERRRQEEIMNNQRAYERAVERRRLHRAELNILDAIYHINSQFARQAWPIRTRSEMRTTPKSLSLKMVSDFQKDYSFECECSICYERIPNIGLPCKHTFCGDCTVKFSQKDQSCPLCRSTFNEVHISQNIDPNEFNKISAKLSL